MKTFLVDEELFKAIYFVNHRNTKFYNDCIWFQVDEFKFMKKEEKKMTKQEALKAIKYISITNFDTDVRLLASLEALGLLKFEEEKKVERPKHLLETILECRLKYEGSENFLNALEAKGYKITNG